ncbi:protein argonaute 1D-like [Miscanthus floridulus]|uniref:protein argonaute 1D-like n=1 Tax=Miscanthus floridulus TaxID=154761 RepID=UPI003457B3CD
MTTTSKEMQALINNLCYTYASGTQSVSIVPPAYYAQKLTQRARVYLAQVSDTASSSSSGSAAAPAPAPAPAPGGGPKQLPEIKDELKRSMFYC